MSIHELNKIIEELGHADAILMYYSVEPDKDLSNGLRELSNISICFVNEPKLLR